MLGGGGGVLGGRGSAGVYNKWWEAAGGVLVAGVGGEGRWLHWFCLL